MEKVTVIKNSQVVGEVYFNKYSGVWVAQLDKAISIRSQSFLTQAEAVKALEEFEPSQLEDNKELALLDSLAKGLL